MQSVLPDFYLNSQKLEIITYVSKPNHFDNVEKIGKILLFLTFLDGYVE